MQTLDDPTTLEFAIGDFTAAWNAMAGASTPPINCGNFLFALQGMGLLELATRIYQGPETLSCFTAALRARNPRYFTPLPLARVLTRGKSGFEFPRLKPQPPNKAELLEILFDTVRNGLAHQYAQKHVVLTDGAGHLHVMITGVDHGRPIDQRIAEDEHLAFQVVGDDLWIMFRTDAFFRDVRDASRECSSPGPRGPSRQVLMDDQRVSVGKVVEALRVANHREIDFKARMGVAELSPTAKSAP